MRRQDPQIIDGFNKLRQTIDDLERAVIASGPQSVAEPRNREASAKRTESTTERSAKLAYSVKEALELVGLSRTSLYAAIGAKELRAVKHHKKTLILAEDLRAWLEKLPEMTSLPRE